MHIFTRDGKGAGGSIVYCFPTISKGFLCIGFFVGFSFVLLFGFLKQNLRDKKGVNSVICTLLYILPFLCIFILDIHLFTLLSLGGKNGRAKAKDKRLNKYGSHGIFSVEFFPHVAQYSVFRCLLFKRGKSCAQVTDRS